MLYIRKGSFQGRKEKHNRQQKPETGHSSLETHTSIWLYLGDLKTMNIGNPIHVYWLSVDSPIQMDCCKVIAVFCFPFSTQVSIRAFAGLISFKAYRASNYFTALWSNVFSQELKRCLFSISGCSLPSFQANKSPSSDACTYHISGHT